MAGLAERELVGLGINPIDQGHDIANPAQYLAVCARS
jgi:hypothetical protein